MSENTNNDVNVVTEPVQPVEGQTSGTEPASTPETVKAVPMDRFNQVYGEMKTAKEQAELLRQELEWVKSQQAQPSQTPATPTPAQEPAEITDLDLEFLRRDPNWRDNLAIIERVAKKSGSSLEQKIAALEKEISDQKNAQQQRQADEGRMQFYGERWDNALKAVNHSHLTEQQFALAGQAAIAEVDTHIRQNPQKSPSDADSPYQRAMKAQEIERLFKESLARNVSLFPAPAPAAKPAPTGAQPSMTTIPNPGVTVGGVSEATRKFKAGEIDLPTFAQMRSAEMFNKSS